MRIDQVLPDFAAHDAIGSHVLQIRRILRGAGHTSDIYAGRIDPRLRADARPYTEWPGGDALIFHQSTDAPKMADWLVARDRDGVPLVFDYHNITPARYFARWEPAIAATLRRAREQLLALAPHPALALADSAFNAEELAEAGYREPTVSPLLVDLDAFHAAPQAKALRRLRRRHQSGGADWLFVGRIAPNKCQHDVVAAFAVYRRLFDPQARLALVGGPSSFRYLRALERLAGDLGVSGAVEFLHGVAFPELLARYRTADVLVCLSEHEGFCAPLVEAMELEVPVIAYRAAAVPDTAGAGAVLLDDKDPLLVASEVNAVLSDPRRRQAVIDAGRQRAAELSLAANSARFLKVMSDWIDRQPGR